MTTSMADSSGKDRIRILFLGFVGFFCFAMCVASLCAPTLRHIFIKKIDEHRDDAPAPDIRLLFAADASPFAAALNAWADDHVGLRDPLIRLKTQLDYSLFHTSRKVYIGSDGFLFARDWTDHLIDLDRADPSIIEAAKTAYTHLASILAARDITLVIVMNPDKARLYPEHLPDDAPMLQPHGQLDQFKDFFAHMPGVIFIDAEKLLSKKEGELPLYYKLDLHHRPTAAIPVVKEIIRQIADKEDRPDIKWNEHFHFNTPKTVSGGSDARFLGLLHPLNEEDLTAPDLYKMDKPQPDGHWMMGAQSSVNTRALDSTDLFDFEFTSNPSTCANRLPTTMVFGNSFTDYYWATGMQRYFCFIRRSRPGTVAHMQAFLDNMPPHTKYFIYQLLTSQILSIAPPMQIK